ncbi:S9 family peptidase [Colwellia asteriadis]|uniref:S9 family peptidase n=1 Tax=Colwellia asteriadis TaxID=517723 RepID=A0ABN1LAW7_9GAMM
MLYQILKFLSLLIMILSFSVEAENSQWEQLFDHSSYQNAKISPDGKHLAVAANVRGKVALIVFKVNELNKPVGFINFSGRTEVGEYHWVNNERLVLNVVKRVYSQAMPVFYGELYAVNMDGSRGRMIYGVNAGEIQTGSRLKKRESIQGWGEVIDTLPEDEDHILISSTPMSSTGERLATVYRLNVYTGHLKNKLGTSPIPFARFITDTKGELRALVGTDENNYQQIYIKQGDSGWAKLAPGTTSSSVWPLSINGSGEYLYTLDNHKQDLDGIFKLNLNDFSYQHVYTDPKVDITNVEMATDRRSAYAIRTDENYPAYLILDKKAEEAGIFKNLLTSFPNQKVKITSKTQHGDFYVFMVSSDVNPGTLYLYDLKNNTIKYLFKLMPNFHESDFAAVEPIQYSASDGQVIHGYLTQAKTTLNNKVAPVVVLVHGGPHGPRDYWGFSSEVQYLALNGYSVLQVNFRGSGGYGVKFETDGHQQWGSRIQQDILEGFQWLVKEGMAETDNACIMGASFGAYSAVQSAAIYPDTYQCAIANAGIYDLELMFDKGDVQARDSGLSYLQEVLGTNEAALKSMSPVNYASKITIPLLLAHGEDDERAPFEHVESLRDSLDKANKSYEWFFIDKEGHGFYNPETQKAYMRKVITFLDKHLDKT